MLFRSDGHIKLTDFGLAKELPTAETSESRTKTFCGTSEYLAPEVIQGISYGESVDWWSLGIVLYEMLTGWPPWTSENREVLYELILTEPLPVDDDKLTASSVDLLQKMLAKDVQNRITPEEIQNHLFFSSIDFDKLLSQEITPPFKPELVSL